MQSNWRIKFYTFLICIFTFISGLAADDTDLSGIDVAYTIDLNSIDRFVEVTASFKNVTQEVLWIGFPNSFYIANQYNLFSRIEEIELQSSQAVIGEYLQNEDIIAYRIDLNGDREFSINYSMDPKKTPFEHHLLQITETTMHIPGLDFFIRAFADEQEVKDFYYHRGLNLFQSYSLTMKNLPVDWQILSTYEEVSANTIYIDDRHGSEVLLSMGNYDVIDIPSGDALIRIAVDQGMNIHSQDYIADIGAIFQSFVEIYDTIPEEDILMINNTDPRFFGGVGISLGGQYKRQNIINCLGWGRLVTGPLLKGRILGHIAHEGHHIWLSGGYEHKNGEHWYWFSESVTEYISEKILVELGLVSEEYFLRQLALRYLSYTRNPHRNSVNLVQASEGAPNNYDSDLQYDKGMIVAYLLDIELQKLGLDIETLLSELYRAYAVEKVPMGNDEIIAYIDTVLNDDSFSESYILGTQSIDKSQFDFGIGYYWWAIEQYLPPVAFPLNVIVPLLMLYAIGLILWAIITTIKYSIKNGKTHEVILNEE